MPERAVNDHGHRIGYYSQLQYCPDHRRREVANVGVALFVPSLKFGEAKFSRDHGRATTIFGAAKVDEALLTMAIRSFRAHFTAKSAAWPSREQMARFGRRLGNDLVMTEPEAVVVEDAVAELEALFQELVEFETAANLETLG